MRKALMVLVVAGIGAALVAAGCGGDDDATSAATTTGATGSGGGEPLSKQEFISEADAICKQGDKEIAEAGREQFGNERQPSEEEQEQFVTDTVIPNIQNQVDSIRSLTPPEGDEDQVTAILDAAQEGIAKGVQDPSSFTVGAGEDPFAEANRLAQDYGLTACGGG
jgi:hypothetical protein